MENSKETRVEQDKSNFLKNLSQRLSFGALKKMEKELREIKTEKKEIQKPNKIDIIDHSVISKLRKTTTKVHGTGCVDGSSSIKKNEEKQDLWDVYANCCIKNQIDNIAKKFGVNQFLKPSIGGIILINSFNYIFYSFKDFFLIFFFFKIQN